MKHDYDIRYRIVKDRGSWVTRRTVTEIMTGHTITTMVTASDTWAGAMSAIRWDCLQRLAMAFTSGSRRFYVHA